MVGGPRATMVRTTRRCCHVPHNRPRTRWLRRLQSGNPGRSRTYARRDGSPRSWLHMPARTRSRPRSRHTLHIRRSTRSPQSGIETATIVRDTLVGDEAEPCIADVAREAEADLIVIASRGRGPFAGALLGSTTQRLLPIAACPVLVVPGGYTGTRARDRRRRPRSRPDREARCPVRRARPWRHASSCRARRPRAWSREACSSSREPTPPRARSGPASTLALLIPLTISVGRSLLRGDVGVDAIALLAMAGALALGEYLAGAVIALMLAGGNALELCAQRAPAAS